MKKFTAFCTALALSASLLPTVAFAQTDFPDLPADHWAYTNIQALVAEGTIRGYEDGTFRPAGTVTRAEFVKMIGNGPIRYMADFADVPTNHWAYEYVMTSGLVPNGTPYFLPSQPITRIEVIELLWKRAGAPKGFSAPSIITSQAPNSKDALAWAYTLGIANGDDGISLRANDSMSRAEGAALIIRARQNAASGISKSFADVANAQIMAQTFTALDLFDDPTYTPDKAITYGELARAIVRLAGNEYNPTYYNLPSAASFDHPYARDLDVLGRKVIGTEKATAAIIDTQVTVADVVASLSFATLFRSAVPYASDVSTPEFADKMSTSQNNLLTFALKRGIFPGNTCDYESLMRPATQKDFAAVAIQLDQLIGLQTEYSTDGGILGNGKSNRSLDLSGRYYEAFQLVLKDIPNAVYTTPFTLFGATDNLPKSTYRFTQAYHSQFTSSLSLYKNYVKNATGLDCTFVFTPSLTASNGNGYTMRTKITVNAVGSANTLGACFKVSENADANFALSAGQTFYADIASGGGFASTMNVDTMFIDKIIY